MTKGVITKIPTKDMSRPEWLAERRKRIGGSDASTIVGLNPYGSLYALWAEKVGAIGEKEDNEAMRLGRDLEDYVAKRFTEATGKRVRRENYLICNSLYPFAHANVDRVIVGENAVLECKTTSVLNLKKFKGNDFPEQYYAQCVHYLMVACAKRIYLAVLILGKDFRWYVLERDEDEIAALAKAEKDFFETHVKTGIPPAVDGRAPTGDAMAAVYGESNDETVDLSPCSFLLEEYESLTVQIKALEKQRDYVANKVKERMKEAGRGESASYSVSWTSSERRTFDHKRFADAYRSINLDPFYKTSQTRTFRVIRKETETA